MEGEIIKKKTKNGQIYTYRITNGKKVRISTKEKNKNPIKKHHEGRHVCSTDTNGNLRVYHIKNRKKVRVSNNKARECKKSTLKNCEYPCDTDEDTGKTVRQAPCRYKRTVFAKQQEIDDFCSLKVTDPNREDENKKAKRANKELKLSMEKYKNKTTKPKLQFAEFLEEYIEYDPYGKPEFPYKYSPNKLPGKSILTPEKKKRPGTPMKTKV